MKRMITYMMCLIASFAILTGCSEESNSNVNPAVDNGSVDDNYIGDPNPVLEENYKQTPAEAKQLEDLKKQIEQEEKVEEEESSGGGHIL
ncbi:MULTISPECIES: hypothetical protein [Bacillus]|uniref:hypothetical protein n=1 Tax=Bacillus TaxID=1386 RepID=UPI0002F15CA9|nr:MULTISPECIES: hypothetical protein [Bacillus]